jgi:hypothetical protein
MPLHQGFKSALRKRGFGHCSADLDPTNQIITP